MKKRLFIGNLSYDAKGLALREIFEACGEVADVRVMTDGESGRPRGYALVTMATASDARAAIKRLDGASFDGRPLHVTMDAGRDAVDEEEKRKDRRLARTLRRLLGYVRYARDHEGAAAASLFLFDDRTGGLQGVLTGGWDWTRTSFPSHESDWPTVSAAVANRDVCVITAEGASEAEKGWFEARGIQGSVCVPLCEGTRRLGVLFFDFDASTRTVHGADVPFLTDVGERCARALGRTSARG